MTVFIKSYPDIDPIESPDLVMLEICELTPLSPFSGNPISFEQKYLVETSNDIDISS